MNQKVLLVDDEAAVLDPLTQVIGDMGIETLSTTNPVHGVELARSHSPAVVITDLRMPGIDGLELLRQIRSFLPGAQVVMISGHANVDEAVAAMKKGAYDFITKPFTVSEIENVVLRALEKAALVDENDRLRDAVRRSRMPSFSQGRN